MQRKQGLYEKYIKRLIDIVCSLSAILVFCWLYAIIALLVKIKLGGPVLFRQPRPGKNEKIFNMYKFRTMTDERDEKGELLSDEIRLTRFGKWLRSTSLDELPEAFNILKGDMSIIGPRPLLVQYLPLYNESQKHRHDVRPGLSGWAQINGRNALSWEEKFRYDVEYTQKISFLFDCRIVYLTVYKVFKRDGISQAGEATMEVFTGSKTEDDEVNV
ncbi:MAG: sugar transferase [Oscillospiraceae bacterium]|nr:sugar transferase [Oscillospiraceae bacterium]